MRTSELTGAALDWAVGTTGEYGCGFFSTDWAIGGPIIERERIRLMHTEELGKNPWSAILAGAHYAEFGPTPLIAAMRCYVASKLGDEVDIPEELK
jgi:hypothetical protein